jgi:hypothetical protein
MTPSLATRRGFSRAAAPYHHRRGRRPVQPTATAPCPPSTATTRTNRLPAHRRVHRRRVRMPHRPSSIRTCRSRRRLSRRRLPASRVHHRARRQQNLTRYSQRASPKHSRRRRSLRRLPARRCHCCRGVSATTLMTQRTSERSGMTSCPSYESAVCPSPPAISQHGTTRALSSQAGGASSCLPAMPSPALWTRASSSPRRPSGHSKRIFNDASGMRILHGPPVSSPPPTSSAPTRLASRLVAPEPTATTKSGRAL